MERVLQMAQRVLWRPSFNKHDYDYYRNEPRGVSAHIPPELRELIHRSLDIEPELWEFDVKVPDCNKAYNVASEILLEFRLGAHWLQVTHGSGKYGRIENWTAGLPGTWRHKLVQRVKDLHAQAHKKYLYEHLGREQAKMELRNAGKVVPHKLPARVKDPGAGVMTPRVEQGAVMGAQVLRRMTFAPEDHSADALRYASMEEKASAIEQQMKAAAGQQKLKRLATGLGGLMEEEIYKAIGYQTIKAPKT